MTLITIRRKKHGYFSALPTHESSEGEQVLLPQIYDAHLAWRKCRSFQWNVLLRHSTDSFAIVPPVLTRFLFQAVQSIYMKYSNYALRASPCNFQRAKHTQLASSTYFQAWYLGKSSLHFWEYSGSGYTTNIPLTSVQPGGGGRGIMEGKVHQLIDFMNKPADLMSTFKYLTPTTLNFLELIPCRMFLKDTWIPLASVCFPRRLQITKQQKKHLVECVG